VVVLTDTHCHLDFERYDDDREEVLERAFESGIERILIPGTDLSSSRAAIELAETHPQIFAAVGFHPNEATRWEGTSLAELKQLITHPKVVAVGEIGLDYYRDWAPVGLQKHIFLLQLSLAADSGLPVVIHNRQATVDLLAILTKWQAELLESASPLAARAGVLHSFSDDIEIAQQAMAIGFYIGITGPVTFPKADTLRRTAAWAPNDRLLVETDSPFLTPHPHRGKRNEPAYVRFVAEKISEIKSLSLEVVAEETSANADRLFNWRETA
jgi:TatD DNase family protein